MKLLWNIFIAPSSRMVGKKTNSIYHFIAGLEKHNLYFAQWVFKKKHSWKSTTSVPPVCLTLIVPGVWVIIGPQMPATSQALSLCDVREGRLTVEIGSVCCTWSWRVLFPHKRSGRGCGTSCGGIWCLVFRQFWTTTRSTLSANGALCWQQSSSVDWGD